MTPNVALTCGSVHHLLCVVSQPASKLNVLVNKLHEFLAHPPLEEDIPEGTQLKQGGFTHTKPNSFNNERKSVN